MSGKVPSDNMKIIWGSINEKCVFPFTFLPRYEYVLREKTWIEYWPTELECRTPKYRPTCEGIEDLNLKLVFDGCMEWRYGIMD